MLDSSDTNRLYSAAFFMLSAANFFMICSFACFLVFPLFIIKIGGSKTDIGILMGGMSLAAVLGRPWISSLVDLIGRKRSFTLGSLSMVVISLIYIFLQGELTQMYLPIFLLRLAHGICVGMSFVAALTFAMDLIPPGKLNEGIGMFGVTGLLAMAIGPMIAEAVVMAAGFTYMFITASGLALLAFLCHLPVRETYNPHNRTTKISFFSTLRDRRLSVTTIIIFLFGWGIAVYGSFVTPYVHSKGLSAATPYFICYSTTAIVTRLFGGRIGDQVGEARLIPIALIITSIGFVSLVFLNGWVMLCFSGLITGTGHGILFPSLMASAVRHIDVHARGQANGILTGGMDLGVFCGSIIMGLLGDWFGFQSIFVTASCALLIGLLVFRTTAMSLAAK